MRHRMKGKQLSRSTSHRMAMRRNMAASLFEHGAIRTTEIKAKEIRSFVERLITIARQGTLAARRQVISLLQDREIFSYDETEQDFLPEEKTVIQKLFEDIAPRYKDRPGGYTRIIRISERRIGDAGRQVVLQLVEEATEAPSGSGGGSGRRRKRAEKRHRAAKGVSTATTAVVDTEEAPAEEPAGDEQPGEEAPADEQPADSEAEGSDEDSAGEDEETKSE